MTKTNKSAANQLGVRIIKGESPRGAEGGSKQLDPFKESYVSNELLEPPYNPSHLAKLPEMSNVLQPLIDAYVTNITGFGYSFKYLVDIDSKEIQKEIIARAKQEWLALEFFYNNCNFDKTYTKITKMMVQDRETIGWGTIEVIPKGNGDPGGLEYMPAHTVRLTKLSTTSVRIPVISISFDGKKVQVTHIKRFRKFCQERDGLRRWFKEFGDPRVMDAETGKYQDEVRELIPFEKQANSVMYFPIHVAYSPYGVPRWMGTLISILGSRKSEELNFHYFNKGKHIPMAILVKNGSLTESSVDLLESYSEKLQGVENAHGFLVIEADAGSEEDEAFASESKPPVDIKLQPLTQILQHDALFQEYDKNNRDKVRAQMKLPPIYTGESRDYTRATADTARAIAEEQIFNPERLELAHKFNQLINHKLDIRYINMYFKGPDLSNKKELAQALLPYIKAGALTPNMLVGAVSELLRVDFEQIQEDWGDKPLQLSLAEIGKGVEVQPAKTKPTVTDNNTTDPIKT